MGTLSGNTMESNGYGHAGLNVHGKTSRKLKSLAGGAMILCSPAGGGIFPPSQRGGGGHGEGGLLEQRRDGFWIWIWWPILRLIGCHPNPNPTPATAPCTAPRTAPATVPAHRGAEGPQEGGRGSKGEGTPPCQNIPNTQQIEKLLGNDPFRTWKCHSVNRKQNEIIIVGQFRVRSLSQFSTNTRKRESGTLHITSHYQLFVLFVQTVDCIA